MTHTVELLNVSKTLRKNKILSNITLSLHSDKVVGLMGVNGSGKTMLMRIVSGLIRPSEGTVIIDGERLHTEISFPRSCGLLLENPSFIENYSGFKNLKMLASIRNRVSDEDIRQTISIVGLDPDSPKKYRKYSLGMKQRLGIAAAIVERPDIVILDEPTNSLDSQGVLMVKDVILQQKKRGALVILACHDMSILRELSDVIYHIDQGVIVSKMLVNAISEEHANENF